MHFVVNKNDYFFIRRQRNHNVQKEVTLLGQSWLTFEL